jgi:hypothetical protein
MTRTILATAALVVGLSGCATIFDGATQAVAVRSAPEAATFTITNRAGEKVHVGTTPSTVTLKRGAGYFKREDYTVRVEKDGFKPMEFKLSGGMNGWYFGNILVGGLIGMLLVDPMTGAMFKVVDEPVNVTLEPADAKLGSADGALAIRLVQDVSPEVLRRAQRIDPQ